MTKKEIIKKMVENGYNMMGRTEEWFEQNFTEKDLHFFLENFLKSKKNGLRKSYNRIIKSKGD